MSPSMSARSSGQPEPTPALVLENARLFAELRASLDELSRSRTRILAVADETRAQIGRDLHDGAQQHLFLLRLRLSAESERLQTEQPETAAMLEALGAEVELAIDEVRALARGVYPAMLAGHGLGESLRWAALDGPLVVTVQADGVGRYDPEVERAVYFACMEALQNASKHAKSASRVWITLADDGDLRFEVRDDGAGLDPHFNGSGTGLLNIRDRIAAVGGEVRIVSGPAHGTRVQGHVPQTTARIAECQSVS